MITLRPVNAFPAPRRSEIVFTLKTATAEDPNKAGNWTSPATGIDFLIRTAAQAPGYDYDVHYALVNKAITGNVFAATDTARANPLCAAAAIALPRSRTSTIACSALITPTPTAN